MSLRIHIFTSPRPFFAHIYNPPEYECNIVRRLQAWGPVIDSQRMATKETIKDLQGLVLVHGATSLVTTNEYQEGRIFVLFYFQEPVTHLHIQLTHEFFSQQLYLDFTGPLRRSTRTAKRLLSTGFLDPVQQDQLESSSRVEPLEVLENGYQRMALVQGGEREEEVTRLLTSLKLP